MEIKHYYKTYKYRYEDGIELITGTEEKEGEWLEVEYTTNDGKLRREVQRNDEDVRPSNENVSVTDIDNILRPVPDDKDNEMALLKLEEMYEGEQAFEKKLEKFQTEEDAADTKTEKTDAWNTIRNGVVTTCSDF